MAALKRPNYLHRHPPNDRLRPHATARHPGWRVHRLGVVWGLIATGTRAYLISRKPDKCAQDWAAKIVTRWLGSWQHYFAVHGIFNGIRRLNC